MIRNSAAESVHAGMGTTIGHRVYGEGAGEALRVVESEARRLEGLLSRFQPESEIARLNCSAGIRRVKLSLETISVLSHAAALSAACQGAFDATIGPLVDLWDFKHAAAAPDRFRILQTLSLVNHRDLVIDPDGQTAGLKNAGQSIDLGGVGKGYASDRFMEIFKAHGIGSAFSNLGGNVSTLGTKPDGSPWRVGIRHPRTENRLIGAVEVTGRAVVTSGDYERCFVDQYGRRYHHILNPATGYPAESGLVSVTVAADSAMTADALSTGIFVAGLERGLSILEQFPPVEVVLVDTRLHVFVTPGLRAHFQAASGVGVTFLN